MKYNRAHPYTLIEYLSKFSLLFILPLLQQIIFRPREISETIRSLGTNILFVGLIIFLAFKEYRSIRYKSFKNYFFISKGFFFTHKSSIPYKNIHSITINQTVFPSLFGSMKLKLDTPSKKGSKSDISLNLSKKNLVSTVKSIFKKSEGKSIYKAGTLKIFFMAAFWSNSATGLLIAAPFINKLGYLIGEEASYRLYSTVNISLQLVALGVPPVAAWAAYILAAGWLISLLVQFFRYSGFNVTKLDNYIIINRGLINNYSRVVNTKDINAITIKQSFIMKILRLRSAYIDAIGNDKEKGDKNLLIACAYNKEFDKSLGFLFFEKFKNNSKIFPSVRPSKSSLKSFLIVPIITSIILSIVFFLFYVKTSLDQFVLLFLMFITPAMLVWIIFRIYAHKTSSVTLYENWINISSYKNFSFISSNISLDKIQYIKIKQNPFQKISGRSNLCIYIFSENKYFLTVKHLNLTDVENLVENVNTL